MAFKKDEWNPKEGAKYLKNSQSEVDPSNNTGVLPFSERTPMEKEEQKRRETIGSSFMQAVKKLKKSGQYKSRDVGSKSSKMIDRSLGISEPEDLNS